MVHVTAAKPGLYAVPKGSALLFFCGEHREGAADTMRAAHTAMQDKRESWAKTADEKDWQIRVRDMSNVKHEPYISRKGKKGGYK